MDKQETIQAIKNLCIKFEYTDKRLTEIEIIIKNYLTEHPKDTDMWLRLAMLEMLPPWEDPYKMVSYLHKILSYDPQNIQTILTLAYIESLFFGTMKKATFILVNNIKTDNPEILSMIEYVKALDYELRNKELFEKHLIQSINYCDKHVNNLKVLGKHYIEIGEIEKGKNLIRKALNNIQAIYGKTYEKTDKTDINEFFNYYYKGTHTTYFVPDDLLELLNE